MRTENRTELKRTEERVCGGQGLVETEQEGRSMYI